MKNRSESPFDAMEHDARQTAARCLRILLGCMIVLITIETITAILTR